MQIMKIKNCKFVKLKFFDDGIDGNLVIAESFKNIPFQIKRVYFINNLKSKGIVRGQHAHKKLEQILFCINGSFELELNDGTNKESFVLTTPHIGVYMGFGVWCTMRNFSPDCIILVLASDFYNESEYIRNYSDFLRYVKGRSKNNSTQ